MHGKARDVLPEEADGAGGRREVARDGVEQRGLARTVRTQHGAAFPRRHLERDAFERHQGPELPPNAIEFQRVGAGRGKAGGGSGLGHGGYGQAGLSRPTAPSFRNSASSIPSVWLTCGTTLTTLL